MVLIINPVARRAGAGARGALVRALEEAGELEVAVTAGPDDGPRLAAEARTSGARAIVAAGGDGAVSQVAAELLDGGPPLLPFPLGNANVFARSFGWPADPLKAAAMVGEALTDPVAPREVTPWRVTTDEAQAVAVMNVGVGVDAAVVEWIEAHQGLKRTAGQIGFALGAARSAGDRARLEVSSDEGAPREASSVVAALGSPWAWFGPRRLDPLPAACHDGALHWLGLSGGVLGAAARTLRGKDAAGSADPTGQAWRSLLIESAEPAPVQADGEPLGRSRRARAEPAGTLSVVIPR